MKKLFTVVSILFLTTSLFCKEFIVPDFYLTFHEVEERLSNQYSNFTYNSEHNIYEFSDLLLKYETENISKVMLSKVDEKNYTYSIIFNDLNTNEWTNLILKTIYNYGLDKFKMSDDIVLIGTYNNNYQVAFSFIESSTKTDGIIKIMQILVSLN